MINKGKTVEAMDIEMTAKESISQGYTESIVNIAYTPEIAYTDQVAKLREDVGRDGKNNSSSSSVPMTDTTQS